MYVSDIQYVYNHMRIQPPCTQARASCMASPSTQWLPDKDMLMDIPLPFTPLLAISFINELNWACASLMVPLIMSASLASSLQQAGCGEKGEGWPHVGRRGRDGHMWGEGGGMAA